MTGIRQGSRGRGGISNPNRIAPLQRFGLSGFPDGPWGLWNPYASDDPSNIYTAGGKYDQLGDLSGNGRHMVDDHGFDAADASAEIYLGRLGATVLPETNTLNYLRYLIPSDTALGDVSWVQSGPWAPFDNSDKPFEIAFGTGSGTIVALQFDQGSPEQVELFNVATPLFEYNVDLNDSPVDPDSWYIWVARSSISGSTVTWNFLLIVDRNDGGGPVLEVDAGGTETTSTANPGNGERRAEWRGVRARGTGNTQPVGLLALWTRELTQAEAVQAAIGAAAQFGPTHRAAVAALLS